MRPLVVVLCAIVPSALASCKQSSGNQPDSAVGNTCSAANCGGCCNGDVCEQGITDVACGTGGATCSACSGTTQCMAGSCQGAPMIGVDWRTATASAAFGARAGFPVADGAMLWVFGGTTSGATLKDVWHSADGGTWTASTATPSFGSPYGPCALSFGGTLWFLETYNNPPTNTPGFWSSPDGVTWTEQVSSLPFSSRLYPACVVWNSQMWVIGGVFPNPGGQATDVWSSSNGTSWTQTTTAYGPSASSNYGPTGAAVLNGKLYVALATGIYSTPDGATWTPETLAFTGANGLVAAGGKLWTTKNSYGVYSATNGVYSSTDGASWTLESAPAALVGTATTNPPANGTCGPRQAYGFAAFAPSGASSASLYLIAGVQSCRPSGGGATAAQYLADVWVSP